MDYNFILALIALSITVVSLSFLLGLNMSRAHSNKEIYRLRKKVQKLKVKNKGG